MRFATRWRIRPIISRHWKGRRRSSTRTGERTRLHCCNISCMLRPNDPTSHAMLAVLAYRRGDCAAAVPHFEQSGSLAESQPGALQELRRLSGADEGDSRRRFTSFSRALAQSNSDAGVRYRLASRPNHGAAFQRCYRHVAASAARKRRPMLMSLIWPPPPTRPMEILRRRSAFFARRLWRILTTSISISISPTFLIDHQSFSGRRGYDQRWTQRRAEGGGFVCGARRALRAACAI